MEKTSQRKVIATAALAAMMFGLAACDNDDAEGDPDQQDAAAQEAPDEGAAPDAGQEMPEPDLGDVPDVVAEVEGEEISGEEYSATYEAQFAQVAMQAQMTGEELDEEALEQQILDNLIAIELLTQDAAERGYEASEEDIEAELQQTAEDNGFESSDEFLEMAEEQGISEDDLRDDVEQQVLISQVIDSLDVEQPSDEEVEAAYDEFTQQQGAIEEEGGEDIETPSLEELAPEIEEQLIAENENEAALAHVEQLREDADVEVYL